MPTVKTQHITDQPAERVWRELLDCEAFPSYMAEVQEITIITPETDGRRSSRWSVLLKGSVLEWEEEEFIDHEQRRIEFRQLDGDLAYFNGHWQVSEEEQGILVELYVDFDIGIPLMAEMLNPVAARALEDNSRSILEQLERRAREGVGDAS